MSSLKPATLAAVSQLIDQQRLPAEFINSVLEFYLPLAIGLNSQLENHQLTKVGVQGSQGSGKSTCAEFIKILLQHEFDKRVLVASIDDFYLTKLERETMAREVHPLFATRGVPGTHDVRMIQTMFELAATSQTFSVPIFDKSVDDRAPSSQWQQLTGPFDVVILEGWCVGIDAEPDSALAMPKNQLERLEDVDFIWRKSVNRALSEEYAELFARLDVLVALQAPSFACVYGWRLLQEQKMIDRLQAQGRDVSQAQTPAQIERFISHYQRLTEHALATMPQRADWLLTLNNNHQFESLRSKS
ncbi:phosphoribulokinase [Arenicella xantha]|uniref:D-glycerate 3-kinase n=1 Tax=Arenicella xantha TaxID=644221 RepID=A0A395JKJ8_9GAMM|nr:phosphoribulokinase [Arenicella xantha]RBP49308.1 D-glycerate 3-kinase [Arenicella xantha]